MKFVTAKFKPENILTPLIEVRGQAAGRGLLTIGYKTHTKIASKQLTPRK